MITIIAEVCRQHMGIYQISINSRKANNFFICAVANLETDTDV